MSLGQIIRKKREQLHLTLDDVSAGVGFSKPYLSTIETGKVNNPPSDELLTKLEKTLEFEPGLLLHIAHMESLPPDIRQGYESAEAENQKLRQFIKNIVHKKTDQVQVDTFLAENEKASLAAGRLIPVINKVTAGYPAEFNDLDYPAGVADDYVRCPDLHDTNAFAVRVIGDSMEPKFSEGDIVVFSPAAEVHSGDDCFIRFAMPHETTFKRVFFEPNDNVRLQPRNEKYPPMIIDGKRIDGLYRAIIKYEKL
ncbi:MAG: XRE family transcriptional regulator [Phycisphaerae bacterium]|nr:XRE family transcriptional regulator [Phycisphaerae bacterium]MDD5380748.1 XRE family transcriptional regulator [Phycisphaerae bacterium]